MDESAQVSGLVGEIYDAALDPGLWPGALRGVAGFIPAVECTLFSKDIANKTASVYHNDGGVDPHYRQLYFDTYARFDPSSTVQFFAELCEPISTTDFMPYPEFLETRFYKEWALPQGFVDAVTAVLEKSATGFAVVGAIRHKRDGMVDEGARNRMRLIAPHLRRAALIGRVIDLKTAQAATFADTLDGITAGMFLVDATGRVVHANNAASAMLVAGDVVRESAGKLAATDPQANQSLSGIFASAGSDEDLGTRGIAIPLTSRNGDRYVAHLLPLSSGARRQAGTNFSAAAALFVRRASLETPGPPEIIAKSFKLTPTELRVLLAVVDVGGAPEVAEALGVAETTVKFHLKRLFEKTETRRQADLVKIVAGYANMPAG